MFYIADSKQPVVLAKKELGKGGEAHVFEIQDLPNLVAKIYHKPDVNKHEKLKIMLAHPPSDKSALAWPEELVFDSKGSFTGYIMPRISKAYPIFSIYNPSERLNKCPEFNYRYLLRTVCNLWIAAKNVHKLGHVIGDVNESNILVSDQAELKFVDTDSFQIINPRTSEIYRCPVGKPEFAPPELQGADFSKAVRDKLSDRFSLAVLSYQLLMEGWHPYAFVWPHHSGDSPKAPEKIQKGMFPYAKGSQYQPPPSAPDFNTLPVDIRELFLKCFDDGTKNKSLRPDPIAWIASLKKAEKALVQCSYEANHFYLSHLSKCPWCQRNTGQFPVYSSQLKSQAPFYPSATSLPPTPQPSIAPPPSPLVPSYSPPKPVYSPPTSSPSPNKSKSSTKVALAAAAGIAILIVFILIGVSGKKDSDDVTPETTPQVVIEPINWPQPREDRPWAIIPASKLQSKPGAHKTAEQNLEILRKAGFVSATLYDSTKTFPWKINETWTIIMGGFESRDEAEQRLSGIKGRLNQLKSADGNESKDFRDALVTNVYKKSKKEW